MCIVLPYKLQIFRVVVVIVVDVDFYLDHKKWFEFKLTGHCCVLFDFEKHFQHIHNNMLIIFILYLLNTLVFTDLFSMFFFSSRLACWSGWISSFSFFFSAKVCIWRGIVDIWYLCALDSRISTICIYMWCNRTLPNRFWSYDYECKWKKQTNILHTRSHKNDKVKIVHSHLQLFDWMTAEKKNTVYMLLQCITTSKLSALTFSLSFQTVNTVSETIMDQLYGFRHHSIYFSYSHSLLRKCI